MICPLSNEPCNNPKTESIIENINGVKSQINLCKACCNSYFQTSYFKDEFNEFHQKDKEYVISEKYRFIKDLIKTL